MTAAVIDQYDVIREATQAALRNWPPMLADPDDAAQDTAVSLLEAARRREVPNHRGYVWSTASRRAVDLMRRGYLERANRSWFEVPDAADTDRGVADHAAGHVDARRELARLLAAESPQIRRLLWLRLGCGLSMYQVADMLGMTPGAVRVAQHRAVQRIRTTAGGAR